MASEISATDVVVVGRGMFGSAAAKHLAAREIDVVAIGPSAYDPNQPDTKPKHRVFSSHNDEARLTRLQDSNPSDLAEVQAWFGTDTDADYLPMMQPALEALWPQTSFLSFRTRPCIVTYTPNRYPLITEVEPGVIVATGGNGGGAKGSGEWGAMAAEMIVRSS